MVALTKAQAKVALDHVLQNLFELDKDAAMIKAFTIDGVNDIRDVLAMDYEHYAMLTYTNDKGDTVVIPPWQKSLLKILKSFNWWQSKTSFGPVDDWTQVTKENFDDFCLGPDYQSSYGPTSVPSMMPPQVAPQTSLSAPFKFKDPIGDFKKGIKRDPSLFMVYKDEKQWDNWQRSTVELARAQGVEEVLDINYVPTDSDDVVLFEI
jgi:hypothetical protein